jgi:hypothetical protein
MIAMMGPSPAPIETPAAAPSGGLPLSKIQMIAVAILAVAYYKRERLGRNGLIVAALIAAALIYNERRQKVSGYCPTCKK